MGYSKKEAVSIVIQCAKHYKEQLAGNSLLFLCINKHNALSCMSFVSSIIISSI